MWWKGWRWVPACAHSDCRFYESGRFSDVTLECQGKEFEVHRLILAFSSEHFARLLQLPDTGRRISLDFPDPDCVFPDIIRYMYTGEIVISAEKAVPLLAMADHYQVPNEQQRSGVLHFFFFFSSRPHVRRSPSSRES